MLSMFCPTGKNSKSRKSSNQQVRNNSNNNFNPAANNTINSRTNIGHGNNTNDSVATQTNGNNTETSNHLVNVGVHLSNIPSYRYVKAEFRAIEDDEISVLPGDVVLYEFSDRDSNGRWSHVLCLRKNQSGFVPSEILTLEPRRDPKCKKKIPRSIADPVEHVHHSHVRDRHTHPRSQPVSNENIPKASITHHRNACEHQPRFGLPHSLQGSSGQQSFSKYPDLRYISPHTCYNSHTADGRFENHDMNLLKFRPFPRENYGLYVVINNFVAREENDLSVNQGEFVNLLNKEDPLWSWVRREDDGLEGFVPSKFICDHESVRSIIEKGNSTVTMKSSNHNDFHTYINHRPDRDSLPTDQQSSSHQNI